MMESCEESPAQKYKMDEKCLQTNLMQKCTDQSFEFGAEIATKTNSLSDSVVDDDGEEVETKTNVTKITTVIETLTTSKIEIENSSVKIPLKILEASAAEEDKSQDFSPAASAPLEEGEEDDDDDDDSYETDDSSSDSDFSDLSGLSDVSGKEWKPISARPINWVQKQIHSGVNPRDLLQQMLPSSVQHQIAATDLNDMTLWRILVSMLSEPPRRQKLRHVNTFEDIIDLIIESKNIMVLTGAGVSVSCGIPDFRSSDGIYSRLAKDYPDLPDPQAMFDINYFSKDPRPFYKFAREIYPGQFRPSPCHRFIKLLEQKQKLLRNYTQNIDTLEQVAGIQNVIECHGSFSTASCTKCKFKCNADAIRADIFSQRIPVCPRCQPNVHQSVDASEPVSEMNLKLIVANGIMKPDIVFFGEGLPEEFHTVMASDKDKCDLLIVIGSSLKVRPVALIPSSIPANVPQILINREQLHHLEFDVELLGDSDVIINQICHSLGKEWKEICYSSQVLSESKQLLPRAKIEENKADNEVENICEGLTHLEDDEQQQDADTQSIKSNASTDIAVHSAGACSESGFESSTSMGDKFKGANHREAKCKAMLKPPTEVLLDEPMDAAVDGNTQTPPPPSMGFHSFSERLNEANYRHLSIDSSKDSGIQCESSNSSLLPGTSTSNSHNLANLPASLTNFGDRGGTKQMNAAIKTPCQDNNTKTNMPKSSDCPSVLRPMPQHKTLSAAERLPVGTYFFHESTYSYVFPGAQVAWSSSESEDDDDDLPSTSCNNTNLKRHSSYDEAEVDQEDFTSQQCSSNSKSLESNITLSSTIVEKYPEICSPPPLKKRKDPEQITSTIDSSGNITSGSSNSSVSQQ